MKTQTIELRIRLRNATAPLHKQLNQQPWLVALLSKELALPQYQQLLGIYYSLYYQLEVAIKHYIDQQPIAFDYQPRYKAPLLLNDLTYWHIQPEPLCCKVELPSINSLGALLGLFYVLEGSSLGGSLIAQHLYQTHGYTRSTGSDFFSGYGEQTRSHWQSFISYINGYSDQPDLTIQAIDAAAQSFACFNQALANSQMLPFPKV